MSVFRLLKQIRKKRGPKIDPEGALEKTEAKEKKEKKNITQGVTQDLKFRYSKVSKL